MGHLSASAALEICRAALRADVRDFVSSKTNLDGQFPDSGSLQDRFPKSIEMNMSFTGTAPRGVRVS
jgi:hypothetical protein